MFKGNKSNTNEDLWMEVNSEKMNELEKANVAAARFLSLRMHSEKELVDKLKQKGFEYSIISEVVAELKENGYIDDYMYAIRFIEIGYGKKRARKRLAKELSELGISAEIIRNAFDDFEYENSIDEYAMAVSIAKNEIAINDGIIDEKLLGRIARKLERQGFDNIYSTVTEIREWKDINEQ